jgi:hypothetical protein
MANLITGLFDTENTAELAVAELKRLNYGQNEISIIMKDRNVAAEVATHTGSRTMEGAGTGAAIGGTLGAVVIGLLGIGSIAIPGVGLVAAGSLAAMLAGAGAGGIVGTLIGALAGAGVPDDIAPYYERGLNAGGIVVCVAAHPGDEQRVQQVLQGGSVAYAGFPGSNIPSFVSPNYAARYGDLNTPQRSSYDPALASNYKPGGTPPMGSTILEGYRTAESVNAQERSGMRTMAEHERESRRDEFRTDPVSGAAAAVQNEADRTKTALQNQSDKVSTGLHNEADRIQNP